MKKTIAIAIASVLLAGCAHLSNSQEDTSYNDAGKPVRTIKSHQGATALFDSNSQIVKFRATNTDKTQSSSVGSVDQSASSTNAVALLHEVDNILVHAPK